jgi:hypothetical protein
MEKAGTMDRMSPRLLGKRARADIAAEDTNMTRAPKRSRARRMECADDTIVEAVKPRSGLLTPEPSALTESAIPAAEADEPIFPFMSLPAELRLHIYSMALVRFTPIPLHIERAVDAPSSPEPKVHSITPRRAVPEQPFVVPAPADPILPAILRLSKTTHKEARQLLYAENTFVLTLGSGVYTLSTLHQRSRSLIKHAMLTIPSHHDILDGFADLVRLGLRYCWGLKSFRIILQASLPDDGRVSGATSVYANAFHILRWLPRGCRVVLEGCVSEAVRRVVCEEGRLMSVLDEVSFFCERVRGDVGLMCVYR